MKFQGSFLSKGKRICWKDLETPKNRIHLALCREPYIQYMISGTKTIESRITKNKCIPYGKVEKDDLVYKTDRGPVLAVFL